MSNALQKRPHTNLITKLTACQKCHALRIPLKQFVSLNFSTLRLTKPEINPIWETNKPLEF
ncbi:hypothetical protein VCHE40_3210 [Vibrio cholerae HE-40]|nr:hypothetical protein VCHE39_3643 [Vibrio cholerae HE39]EKL34644.1 hypothetical protein VCHE40_3210 [Vibrio cholerae HE-40]EKL37812.1 hypothetical protein VCHE46_3219 [Vibrio cholerae HE-46]